MTQSLILEAQLDLDGLFADFEGGVKAITGKTPKELGDTRRMWAAVHSNKQFFLELEILEGSMDLWAAIKDILPDDRIRFLTGAPSSAAFREQKKQWVAKVFGPQYEVNVVPRRDKPLYSGPLKVLIDDTEDNIDGWVAKGGHGIFHTGVDYDATIKELLDYDAALKKINTGPT